MRIPKRWRAPRYAGLGFVLFLSLFGSVQAADTIGLNLELTADGRRWQAPRFSYGRDDRAGALHTQTLHDWDLAPGFAVTYEPGQMFVVPSWLGERFRYQFRYGRTDGSAVANGTIGQASNPTLVAISGASSIDLLTPATTTLQVDHRNDVFSLGMATDFELWRGITLSPALGVTFGESRQRYRLRILEAATFRDSVSETVRRRFVGPSLGLEIGVPIIDAVRIVGGVSGALLWSDIRLTGDDCSGVNVSNACDGTFFRSAISRDLSGWGWSGDTNLGVEIEFGPVTARLTGMIEAEQARQRIANPRVTGGPATVADEVTLAYGARLGIGYLF